MLSRLAAFCVLVLLVLAARAQEAPPPGDVGPPGPPDVTDRPAPSDRQPSRTDDRAAHRWGAVAYTADGAFGAAFGMESREDAERLAIGECMRESTDKQDCARGAITRQDSWFHILFCRRGSDWATHVITRPMLTETNQAAAQFAQTSRYGTEGCRMVPNGLFHSGGLHTKI